MVIFVGGLYIMFQKGAEVLKSHFWYRNPWQPWQRAGFLGHGSSWLIN